MKKYMKDVIALAVIALVVPLVVISRTNVANVGYNKPLLTRTSISPSGPLGPSGKITMKPEVRRRTVIVKYDHIEKRNIFSPDGEYIVKSKGPFVAKTYRLVGILKSGVKRAVITDNTGEIFILKEGEKLDDNSVVSHIDNVSVMLRKGKKENELKILTVERKQAGKKG